MTQTEALKLALEALELVVLRQKEAAGKQIDAPEITRLWSALTDCIPTITAIKEALAQQSNEQEINPKTTFDEVERGLQQSRMVIATLDSITTEQSQQINEPLLNAQLFLKAISKAVTETAIQKSNEQVEPLWYAVMSETAPIINKAIRSEDVANEYADKCRETYSGVEVIALFAHPPVPTAQPEQEPVAYIHRNEYNEYRLEPHDNFDIKSIPFNVDVSLFKLPQRKPLTKSQVLDLWEQTYVQRGSTGIEFARAIEAAHGITGERK